MKIQRKFFDAPFFSVASENQKNLHIYEIMRFMRNLIPESRKLLERITPNSLLQDQYLKKVLDNLGREDVINFHN